jgi:phage repressor protein C with HTH and peptisase S24 domain
MNNETARRLRHARAAAGFRTAKEFAERHGIPQSTYALHETGARGLKPEIAERYGALLRVSAGWLLTGEGRAPSRSGRSERPQRTKTPQPEPRFRGRGHERGDGPPTIIPVQTGRRDLPVLGIAQGGQNGALIIPVEQRPVDYVFRPPQLEGVTDAFAVFAREDSMDPMYRNGQVLLVHPHLPIRPGDGILIIKQDDHALVKCLIRRTQSELRVRQFNPATEFVISATEIRALYRVVGALDPF